MSQLLEKRLKRIYTEFEAQGCVTRHTFIIQSVSQHFYICGIYNNEEELLKILSDLKKRWRAHYHEVGQESC